MIKFLLFIFCLIAVSFAGDAAVTDVEEDTNPEPASESAARERVRRRKAYGRSAGGDAEDEPAPVTEKDEAAEAVEAAARNATEPSWDRKVMELDPDSFDAVVGRFEAVMVEFYAPWCGHCQEFDPIYQEAAQLLYDGNPRYFLAKIDGSRYPEIKERYEVPGFPTLIFFKGGAPIPYSGERRARALAKWVRKEGPDRVAGVTCPQLAALKQREAHLMVYFGGAKTDSRYLALAALAGDERRFGFYHVRGPECAATHGVAPKTVAFLTNFEGEGARVYAWPGGADARAMAAWYEPDMVPPLSEYEEDIARSMRRSRLPTVVLFRPEDDEFEDYAFVYKRAAVANRGRAIFVWSTDAGEGAELAAHMRLAGADRDDRAPRYPSVCVVWIYRQARFLSYVEPRDHTVATITELVDRVLNGTAKQFLPSQRRPDRSAPPPPGAVWRVVGHTHEDDTTSDERDLLLFWHARGCPHCERYGPLYQGLADRFRAFPQLRFGSIDGAANAVVGADVAGWPLLRFHPRGGAAGARGLDVGEGGRQRDPEVVAQWLLANAPALREALKAAGISTLAELDAASAKVPSALAAEKAAAAEAKAAAASGGEAGAKGDASAKKEDAKKEEPAGDKAAASGAAGAKSEL